jgi:MFS family permease
VNRARVGFGALVVASTVSLLGSRMTAVALPWFVLATSGGDARRLGVVAAVELIPYVVVCALVGPLIDRLGSRVMSIGGDLVSALVVAAIPLLQQAGGLSYPLLLVLVATAGLVRAVGDTAKHGAIFPQTVEAASIDMTRAAGMVDGTSRAASMIGGLLGTGFIVLLGGAANVLLLDAGSFLLCALIVAVFVRVSGRDRSEPSEPYGVALRAGFAFIRSDRLMLGLTLMLFVTNLLDQSFGSVLAPLWSHNVFGSPWGIVLISTTFGAGAVIGNIIFTALAPRMPRWALYTGGFLIVGGPRFALLAIHAPSVVIGVYGVVCGLAIAAVNPILSAVMYERIPAHLLARVGGLGTAIGYAGMPLGALLGGWLGGYGVSFALFVTGGLYFAATLAPLCGRFWRQMDVRPASATREPELVEA